MKNLTRLTKNIIITQLILYLIQAFFFLLIQIFTKIPLMTALYYYPVSLCFHTAILFGLFVLKRFFVLEPSGTPLTRINIANLITLLRISAIPSIFFLLMAIHMQSIKWILIVYISFIFITDFVDGILARKLNQITKIGKYLDSSGDYMILFFTSILYLYYSLIPPWLFILILVRLLSVAIAVVILSVMKNNVVYAISFLGKASIFALMVIFFLNLIPLFGIDNKIFNFILTICEYITGGILILSFGERVFLIYKAFSRTEVVSKEDAAKQVSKV